MKNKTPHTILFYVLLKEYLAIYLKGYYMELHILETLIHIFLPKGDININYTILDV